MHVVKELAEHDRSNVPVMETREFISSVALFFREPDRLVLAGAVADREVAGVASAVERAIRVLAAEAGEVVQG